MNKFFKDFWLHLGFWANPARYIMAEREAHWKMYMGELAYMCKEGDLDNIAMYVQHIRKEMEVLH